MEQNITTLQQWIDESDNIVFFGGAGVSTESGIPDFRSVDGLYHQSYAYPPETILSHSFFAQNPGEFYRFYREKMLIQGAQPTPPTGNWRSWNRRESSRPWSPKTSTVSIRLPGSKVVYELHGSTLRNYCTRCKKKYPVSFLLETTGIPRCTEPNCGAIVRPDVVLYEEGLDPDVISGAVNAIRKADMLIIGGTSLVVYPAAGLINYYTGNKLVLINKGQTSADAMPT